MKQKKLIALTLMLSLLSINKVYADCTQEEIKEFKKIEDEYKITYEFNKDTKDYTVTFVDPRPSTYNYFLYNAEKIVCKDLDEEGINTECYNIPPGEYKIEIKGQTNTCNEVLKDFTLNLPKYNKYYDDPLCEGIEEFVLCQPTYDKEIDYETFKSRTNTYKKDKQSNNKKKTETSKQNKLDAFKSYIEDNIVKIIIIVVFIILLGITTIITINSIRRSRRLE